MVYHMVNIVNYIHCILEKNSQKLKKKRDHGIQAHQFSSVQLLSHVQFQQPRGHARLPCPSPTPGACSNSCSSSWWCHPTISSSVLPFSSCLQSFPASGSSPMSQFFPSGGQSIGASASVLPMNIHDWFDLLEVQGTLRGLLQHHSSKASIPLHPVASLHGK